MKVRFYYFILLLILPLTSQTQTQWGFQGIRGKFDMVYAEMYFNDNFYPWNANDLYWTDDYQLSIKSQNNLGSNGIAAMDALLIMYETTCDIAYLEEFMLKTTTIMNSRADKVFPQFSDYPYWFKDKVVWHGRLLAPLTKFVYLVYNNPNLTNKLISNPSDFGGNSSYMEFANWVNISNQECMDYMLDRFWNSTTKCFCKPNESAPGPTILQGCNNTVSELNYQSPFGCSLIYLYLVNGTTSHSYGLKAVNMAQAYLIYGGGIFTYDTSNLAYSWRSQGWNPQFDYREDMPHGGHDILFPLLYAEFNSSFSSITAGMYFEDYQMVRIRNMFTRVVYNWSENGTIEVEHDNKTAFNLAINGSNVPLEWSPVALQQVLVQVNAISYINLYKYDEVSGSLGFDVYDILMKYYEYEVSGLDPSNFAGLKIRGLAELCAANYDKEGIKPNCFYIERKERFGYFEDYLQNPEKQISFYPNPVEDNFLNISNFEENSTYNLINSLGQVVQEGVLKPQIEVDGLSGVYYITVFGEKTFTEKIIIK